MPNPSPCFPVIAGPTASGKSALAVELALRLAPTAPGEVISADAFQVYRGMDIGTAKPTRAERRAVPHHLIDIREPTDSFTVDDWLSLVEPAIADIRARDRTPIVVGGTHLYIKALLDGLFESPAPDPALRSRLATLSRDELRRRLEAADPPAASRIHPNDLRRTIRALEVHEATGLPITTLQSQWDRGGRHDALLVALQWPTEALNRRINARVKDMLDRGLVDEAASLWKAGRLGPQAREALGYKQLIPHFEGHSSLEDAVERIKVETRRFAKSQRTWIRRLASSHSPDRDTSPNTLPPTRGSRPATLALDADSMALEHMAQSIANKLFMNE